MANIDIIKAAQGAACSALGVVYPNNVSNESDAYLATIEDITESSANIIANAIASGRSSLSDWAEEKGLSFTEAAFQYESEMWKIYDNAFENVKGITWEYNSTTHKAALVADGFAAFSPIPFPLDVITYIVTVNFDANGGTSTPESLTFQNIEEGDSITVTVANAPTKSGYGLIGWKWSIDNKIVQFPYTFIFDANKQTSTFTAQWGLLAKGGYIIV